MIQSRHVSVTATFPQYQPCGYYRQVITWKHADILEWCNPSLDIDGICIISISDKEEHLDFRTAALFLGHKFAGSGSFRTTDGMACARVHPGACSGRNNSTASSSEWHHSRHNRVSISLTGLTRMLCFAPQATNHSTTRGPQLGRTKTDLPDGPFQSCCSLLYAKECMDGQSSTNVRRALGAR